MNKKPTESEARSEVYAILFKISPNLEKYPKMAVGYADKIMELLRHGVSDADKTQ